MTTEIERLRAENAALRAKLTELEGPVGGGGATFLRSLLEALPVFVIRLDPQQRVRFLNRYLPGWAPEQVIGRPVDDFIAPEDIGLVRKCIQAVTATGESSSFRITGSGPGETTRKYETIVVPTTEADGGRSVCLVSLDITEQVDREQALRSSQEALNVAVAATGMGLWRWDLVSDHVLWSPSMHELTGYHGSVTPDIYFQRIIHPDENADKDRWTSELRNHPEQAWRVHRILRPDGSVRWILPSGQLIRDERGEIVSIVGGSLDITEQRLREERLRQTQKLEALGSLTAGVAHNFNNMLAVILPFVESCVRRPNQIDPKLAPSALQATERAARLVHQLMMVAGKKAERDKKVMDFTAVVGGAGEICSRILDGVVTLEVRRTLEVLPVVCDEADLEQVVVNLCLNARDAVLAADHGRPRIQVRVFRVEADAVPPFPGKRSVPHACSEISDNGIGMDDATRARLFEPFFTTKGPDRGTGLGLATSRAIAQEHGGVITCSSVAGKGSTFAVYLPLEERAPEPHVAPALPAAPLRPRRILVVDDDDLVRETTISMLRSGCHDSVAASSAREAVAVLRRNADFDVVLLDRAMPDGAGASILAEVRALAPKASVAYFTGGDVPDEERLAVDAVIQKPVGVEELFAAIESMCEQRKRASTTSGSAPATGGGS